MVRLSRRPGSLGWWISRCVDGILLYVLGTLGATCIYILVEAAIVEGPFSLGMALSLPWIVSGVAAALGAILLALGFPVTRR